MENLHKGHRSRVRAKFKNLGLEGFEEHEILELLLFYVIAQRDTNELAHMLIKKFGSLRDVLTAPYDLLVREKGIGESAALFLKLIFAITSRTSASSLPKLGFKGRWNIAEYMIMKYEGQTKEQLYVLCLDAKLNVMAMEVIFEGEIERINISWRKIVHYLMINNASRIILVHNHPSGLSIPSGNDVYFTKDLKRILEPLGVKLMDHIIVSGNEYTSMEEMGILLED